MCYVIGIKIPKKQTIKIGDKLIALDPIDLPVQSGFTYDSWPVVTNTKSIGMHWELIPHWIRNEKELTESRKKYTTLNIKGESILTNKVAASSIHTHRCLVLASYFFEWQKINNEKYPHCISINETPLFYMGGVWNSWTNHQTGEMKNSFAIITTEANSLMCKIHNTKKRMPTIFDDQLANSWLNENLNEQQLIELATTKIDSDKMKAFTVAKNFQLSDHPCAQVAYKIFSPQSLF